MKVSFEEFEKHGNEQWISQLKKELERVAKSVDTLRFPPEHFLKHQEPQFPVTTHTTSWSIRENLENDLNQLKNEQLLNSLASGVQSVGITVNDDTDLPGLFKEVLMDAILINWKSNLPPLTLHEKIGDFLLSRDIDSVQLKGSIETDPFGHLLTTGNWYENEKNDLIGLAKGIESTHKSLPHYHLLAISGQNYHNAGGTAVQEISMILGHLSEYLAYFREAGLPLSVLEDKIQLTVAAGTDYFTEIAKHRALRLLTAQLLAAYDFKNTNCFIHTTSSYWHMSNTDQHLNVLRTTSAAMSAIIGGCNSLSVLPYNCAAHESTATALRIARNIQHILLEESYMDKAFDPAAGSYFIERLTDDIAEQAWVAFQNLEKDGGFLAAIKAGKLQETLAKQAQVEQQKVVEKKRIVLGVNRHLNPNDNTPVTNQQENTKQASGSTVVNPLSFSRLTAPAEAKRSEFV